MSTLVSALEALPVIGILRGCPSEHLPAIAGAAVEHGMRVLEVTLDSPSPFAGIAQLRDEFPEACTGAGTVRTPESLRMAVEAGAQFIVSPVLDREVVSAAAAAGVEIVPGAATPSEIADAIALGVAAVKVFPAAQLGGPSYLRAIAHVLGSPALIPTGGVTIENSLDYLQSGATALGIGSSVFSREALQRGAAESVGSMVAQLVDRLRQ